MNSEDVATVKNGLVMRILGVPARLILAITDLRFAPLIPMFAVALASIFLILVLPDNLRYPDEFIYSELAEQLLKGNGFADEDGNFTASRPPGYVFLIAASQGLINSPEFVRIVQAILLGGTVSLLALLSSGQIEVNRLVFLLLPVLVCLYPILVYTTNTLYPQTLQSFLLVSCLYLLLRFPERVWAGAVAGVTGGWVCLAVPSMMLLFPILAAAIWLLRLSKFRTVLVFGIVTILVVGAWSARNTLVMGEFVTVSTNGGVNLYMGNHPKARGVFVYKDSAEVRSEVYSTIEDEVERDRRFKELSLEWITENPSEAALLYVSKFLNYFAFYNRYVVEQDGGRQNIQAFAYGLILLILAARLLLVSRFPLTRFEILVLVVYVASGLVQAVFYSKIRYRIPFDLMLLVINAMFLSRLLAPLLNRCAQFPKRSAFVAQ